MSSGRRWATSLLALIAVGLACTDRSAVQPPAAEEQAAIRVTGQGNDEANAICDGFRLSDGQAQEFFAKSVVITEKQLHDDYEYLPCWVEGTTTAGKDKSTWKIRAGATAEIQRANGMIEWRGCDTCDDLFQ